MQSEETETIIAEKKSKKKKIVTTENGETTTTKTKKTKKSKKSEEKENHISVVKLKFGCSHICGTFLSMDFIMCELLCDVSLFIFYANHCVL